MILRDFFQSVYLPLRLLGKSRKTVIAYQTVLSAWSGFSGQLDLAAIDDTSIASFAAHRLAQGRAPATVNKDLRHIKAILANAAKRGLRPPVPEFCWLPEDLAEPEAFLLDEMRLILQAAGIEPGEVGGLPASHWWSSILLACYDSGGRIGAVLAASVSDVSLSERWIMLRPSAQKQRRGQRLRLSEETVAACRVIHHVDRPTMWPWPWRREAIYPRFRRIIERAGVAVGHGEGCLFHRIRKTTASYLQAAGGNPMAQLGHSCQRVTDRYLDSRICGAAQAADLIPRLSLQR